MASTMKAIVCDRYGPPAALRLEEVARPIPRDDEVLVHVHAASVNAGDLYLLRGELVLVRLMFGLLRPRHRIPGSDAAGRVESVGAKVRRFAPGDEVFGDLSGFGSGAFAEYVAAPQAAWAARPPGVSFEQAAAVPVAGVTALQGLRDEGKIQPGHRVLVNGASGGVGTFAVQIARSFGAQVTAVASTGKLDLVRSLGADHVIDYTRQDCTRTGHRYDLILDVGLYRPVTNYRRILAPGGVYVMVGGSPGRMYQAILLGLWTRWTSGPKMGSMVAKPNPDDLAALAGLLESGAVKPAIDRRFSLDDVPRALEYLETGRARGKVVINIS